MNVARPILPFGVFVAVAWFILAAVVILCMLYGISRRRPAVPKVLYTVAFLSFLTFPASAAWPHLLAGWYGGKPDPSLSTDGKFYVRMKHVSYPVSEREFRWLRRMHENRSWYRLPCVIGAACLAAGHMVSRRGSPSAALQRTATASSGAVD